MKFTLNYNYNTIPRNLIKDIISLQIKQLLIHDIRYITIGLIKIAVFL